MEFPTAMAKYLREAVDIVIGPKKILSTHINLLSLLRDIWLMSEINRQSFSFRLDDNALERIYDKGFETLHHINVFIQDISTPSCHRFYFTDIFGTKLKCKFARIYVKSLVETKQT